MTLALGTATISSSGADCSSATTLTTSSCLLPTIANIPNGVLDGVSTAVAAKTASMKVTEPTGLVSGTIVCLSGGDGNSWYENQYPGAVTGWMNQALARGQRIIQVNWTAPGWDDGSVGPRVLADRFATLLKAIHDNANGFSLYSANTPFIAVGHSSGSSLIMYALATYGLGSILDCAVLTSGPPHARIDYACHGNAIADWNTAGPPLCTTGSNITLTAANWANIEISYNNRAYCRSKCMLGGIDNPGERDSIWRSDAILSYQQTDFTFIYGDGDTTAAAPMGRWFNRKITGKSVAEKITTGNVAHNSVPGSTDGAAFINAALAAATYNH